MLFVCLSGGVVLTRCKQETAFKSFTDGTGPSREGMDVSPDKQEGCVEHSDCQEGGQSGTRQSFGLTEAFGDSGQHG